MAHIALYGGSFDPVHAGHGIVACELLNAYQSENERLVDEVWIVPCGERSDKQLQAPAGHRMAMLQLFLEAYFSPQEKVSIHDFEISGPAMLTIDLVRNTSQCYPEHTFSVVIGMDNAKDIIEGRWAGSEDLLREVSFIVYPRLGYPPPPGMAERIGLGPGRFFPLDGDVIATSTISSSLIRRYFAGRKCLSSILPLSVINYIRRNRLYGCTTLAH